MQDWSPDGRSILFIRKGEATYHDLWILPLEGGTEAWSYLATPFTEWGARFSPDGRWVAYEPYEGARTGVQVRSYPAAAETSSVFTDGGTDPLWSPDGRLLYFGTPERRMMDW
jgi:Tol biopolymer transport system component